MFRLPPAVLPTVTYRTKDHVERLRTSLNKLNSLSDLTINFDEDFADEMELDFEIPGLQQGTVFPPLPFGEIKFRLYIPKRIQDELTFFGEATTTEHFGVIIHYAFNGPVVCVECIDASDECAPSDGVVVVREFLKRELAGSQHIEFESIGPSPLHCNFSIQQNEDASGLEVVTVPKSGYDSVEITVPPAPEEDVLENVFYALSSEIDLFYELERERVQDLHAWSELEEKWSTLRDKSKQQAPLWRIDLRIQAHRAARDLITDAYSFAATRSIRQAGATEQVASTYRKGLPVYFQHRIESQLKEAFTEYPTEAIIKWATHIHDSSFKSAEIGTVLVSAIVGGIAGAALTALLTVFTASPTLSKGQSPVPPASSPH
jgi:hypothetical protein